MKGREILAKLKEIEEAQANARSWIQSAELKTAELINLVSVAAEQRAPESERPASDFVVQESDGRDEWASPNQRGVVDFAGDPTSKSVANAVTPKQIGMIRALAREARVDYEAECLEQFNGCKVEDLSKRAASAFIGYLQTIKEQGAEFRKVS